MAGPTPQAPTTSAPAFEVERFEWAAPDRLEVSGRWFGVRGRPFARPTLDVHGAGDQRRLLAVLDHEPWVAEDGQRWHAAFPWEGGPAELSGAELAVAPGIAVALDRPGRAAAATHGETQAFDAMQHIEDADLRDEVEHLRAELAAAQRQRDAAFRERDVAVRARIAGPDLPAPTTQRAAAAAEAANTGPRQIELLLAWVLATAATLIAVVLLALIFDALL